MAFTSSALLGIVPLERVMYMAVIARVSVYAIKYCYGRVPTIAASKIELYVLLHFLLSMSRVKKNGNVHSVI